MFALSKNQNTLTRCAGKIWHVFVILFRVVNHANIKRCNGLLITQQQQVFSSCVENNCLAIDRENHALQSDLRPWGLTLGQLRLIKGKKLYFQT